VVRGTAANAPVNVTIEFSSDWSIVWEGFVARLQVAKAPAPAPERERATDGACIHTPLCRASRPSRPPPLACPPARPTARPPAPPNMREHTHPRTHTRTHIHAHTSLHTHKERVHMTSTHSHSHARTHIHTHTHTHTHTRTAPTHSRCGLLQVSTCSRRPCGDVRRLHRQVRGSKGNPKYWDTFRLFQQPCGSRQRPIMLAVPPIWWHARQRTFRCQNEVPRQGRKILYRRESTLHRCPLVVPLGSNSMPCCISSGTFQTPPVVVLQYVYENAWPPT
jgi:hypothetical protein